MSVAARTCDWRLHKQLSSVLKERRSAINVAYTITRLAPMGLCRPHCMVFMGRSRESGLHRPERMPRMGQSGCQRSFCKAERM